MRSLVGTLVLVGIAGGLALGLWLTRTPDKPPASLTYPLLGGRYVRDAKKITLQNDIEGYKIVFVRDGQRWQIVEPLRDVASSAFLDSIERAYDSAQLVHQFEADKIDAKTLAETGLDKPRCKIAFTFDADPLEIEIGLDGVIGQDLFVRKEGKIWRGGLGLYSVLRATLSDLRERVVFQNERASKITITRKGQDGKPERFALDLAGDAPRIVEPIVSRTDASSVGSIVSTILGMRADTFLQGALNLRPDPDYLIEVEGYAGKEKVMLWGQVGETLLGRALPRNVEFTIGTQRYVATLETPLEKLRSRLVLAVPPEQILRIEIDPGPGRGKPTLLVPALESGTFRLQQPVTSDTDPVVVSQLVSALADLKAERFVNEPGELAKYGLDSEALKVNVVGQFSLRPTTLLIGKDDGEFTWCKRGEEAFAMLVPKASADVLRGNWAKLCSKTVQKVSGAAFQLLLAKGPVQRLWKKSTDDGQWRLEGQKDAGKDLQEIVDVLTNLKAAAVLDPEEVGALEAPLAVELRTPTGDALARVEIFVREGKTLARTDRVALVYELKSLDSKAILSLWP